MSLRYILLGLLREAPSSGYDLNKTMQSRASHFWTSEQSQIYRALYKLADQGLIEYSTVVQDDLPNKKVYQITQAGEDQLEQWLQSTQLDRPPTRTWLAQIFFGESLSDEQLFRTCSNRIIQLQSEREALLVLVDEIQQNINAHDAGRAAHLQLLTISFGLEMLQQEIEQIQQLQAQFTHSDQ